MLSLPLGQQGAGVCWSEWSAGDSAASIGPARNPEELLWVLWSLLG